MRKEHSLNLAVAVFIAIVIYGLSLSLFSDASQRFHLGSFAIGFLFGWLVGFGVQWRDYCKYAWNWIKSGLPKALQRKR